MPWTLKKTFYFEASHQLPNHDGKCARLHGHSWRMDIEVYGTTLNSEGPERGMVVDYGRISEAVKPLLETKLDHWHLNDTTGLTDPTSEALCWWVWQQLKSSVPGINAVIIWETCTSGCRYQPGHPELEMPVGYMEETHGAETLRGE